MWSLPSELPVCYGVTIIKADLTVARAEQTKEDQEVLHDADREAMSHYELPETSFFLPVSRFEVGGCE